MRLMTGFNRGPACSPKHGKEKPCPADTQHGHMAFYSFILLILFFFQLTWPDAL